MNLRERSSWSALLDGVRAGATLHTLEGIVRADVRRLEYDEASGRVLVRINPDYWRPAEIDHLLGNPAKAKARLGWQPTVDVKGLAEMMAEADMQRVGKTSTA